MFWKTIRLSAASLATVLASTAALGQPDTPDVFDASKRDVSFAYRFSDDLVSTPDSEKRLDQWFRDAKFGAFIHFGVYSSLEGQYEGRGEQHRYAEWIQFSARIPSSEYRQIAARFNPVDFDADQWADVFKAGGVRYVVITAKHHEGFAMFKSEASPYNIVDGTEFKRDVIKELNEACHRRGIKFGVYYSHAQDWDEPDAPYLNPRSKLKNFHPELPADFEPDFERYLEKKSLPQVEELVKNYDLDLIWFDTPVGMSYDLAKKFSDLVRKYRPDCLINSRIIYRGKGKIEQDKLDLFDYVSIGDKEVPDRKLPLYFESPDSVSSSFGYKTHGEHHYHTAPELIERLVHTVCAGGNYLLNNGPMGNGRLDPEAVRLYGVLGQWLEVNGASIYATRPNPFDFKPEGGDFSLSKSGRTLYLHLLTWPADHQVIVPGLTQNITGVSYLASDDPIDYQLDEEGLRITLPDHPIDALNTVIAVELAEPLSVR